jgi:hypothetical protein
VDCSFIDFMRRAPRERKPISSLEFIGSWNAILGISDSFIVVYDSDNFTALGQINESKGVLNYSVHERTSLLCTISKRKVSLFLWQGFGFIMRREIPLADTPRVSYCLDGMILLGHKRWYEAMDTSAYATTRLLDVDKEHKMICQELPATNRRPKSVLISTNSQSGTLLAIRTTPSGSSGFVHDAGSRMEWAQPVSQVRLLMPFLVSFESDGIEIHDVGSLAPLQRIPLLGAVSMAVSGFSAGRNRSKGSGIFVGTQDQLYHYSMIPIATQIKILMENNSFEEALSLCTLCGEQGQGQGDKQLKAGGGGGGMGGEEISLKQIHEQFAFSLHQKGDFEGAITQYIAAATAPASVIALFPELIPHALVTALNSAPSAAAAAEANPATLGLSAVTAPPSPLQRLSGVILQRAASALLSFCEHYRAEGSRAADLALQQRALAAQSNVPGLLDGALELRDMGAYDSDERVRTAALLDTVMLSANMICSPPRKQAVVDLVSGANRCHLESCSVILASYGNAFFEALLGLYRSRGEHRKVFAVLAEDKCEGVGAWTREEFYVWVAEYLRWLWYQSDPSLTALVLQHIEPLLRYDAELGVGIFMNKNLPKASGNENFLGGSGVPFSEVLVYLRKIPSSSLGASQKPSTTGAKDRSSGSSSSSSSGSSKKTHMRVSVAAMLMSSVSAWLPRTPMLPLSGGDSLGLVYLEWLVLNTSLAAESAAFIHDEYAKLLMEKIPALAVDHAANDLSVSPQDSEELRLYKILRSKLQALLQASECYRAERIIECLPPQLLHEYALLLCKMDCHEEALQVYVHFLNDLPLAEKYCNSLYVTARRQEALQWAAESSIPEVASIAGAQPPASEASGQSSSKADNKKIQDIYLSLLKILLSPPSTSIPSSLERRTGAGAGAGGDVVTLVNSSSPAVARTIDPERLQLVMETAERHCAKIDACAFLDLLPKNVPAASVVSFVALSMESVTASQHNLQVASQLYSVLRPAG